MKKTKSCGERRKEETKTKETRKGNKQVNV
jgi:hypothetical protein